MVNFFNGLKPATTNPADQSGIPFDVSEFLGTDNLTATPENTGYASVPQTILESFNGTLGNSLSMPPESFTGTLGNSLSMPPESFTGTSGNNFAVTPESLAQILQGSNIQIPPEGYNFNTADLIPSELLEQIKNLNNNTSNIAYESAYQQALSAYIDAYIEAEATKKILQMNNQSTQSNAILDQQMLALRQNYNILTKQTEQYVLDAQVREQLTNIFFSLEKTIMDNRFALTKQVVNSAKY